MRLRSLTLHDYRKYQEEVFEFGDGLIGIVGNNGVGKSTIVEAICVALFGAAKVLHGKRSPRRAGCPEGADWEVILDIELNGDRYTVTRHGSKPSQLQRNNDTTIRGETRVNTEIQQILGLSYEGFRTAFVALQGELNTLGDRRPEPRRELVCEMLGITRIDEARDKAVKHRNELFRDLSNLQDTTKNLPQRREDVRTATEARDKATLQKEEAKTQRVALAEEYVRVSKLADLCKEIAQSQIRLDDLRKEKAETTTQAETIGRIRDQLCADDPLKIEQDFLDREAGRRELADHLAELDRQKLDLEAECPKRAKSVADAQSAHDSLAAKIDNLRKDGEHRRAEVERLRAEATTLRTCAAELQGSAATQVKALGRDQASLQQVRTLGPTTPCPTCRVPLGDNLLQVVGDLEEAIATQMQQVADLRTRTKQLEDDATEYDRLREDVASIKPPLSGLDALIRQDQRRLTEELLSALWTATHAQQNGTNLINDLARQRGELCKTLGDDSIQDNPTRLAEVKEKRGALQKLAWELEGAISRAQELRSTMEIDADITNELQNRQRHVERAGELLYDGDPPVTDEDAWEMCGEQLNTELDALDKTIHGYDLQVTGAKAQLDLLGPILEDLEEKELRRGTVATAHRRIGMLERVLFKLRTNIMAGIRPALESYTSQLLAAVTHGKYQHVVIDEDYQVQIEGTDGAYPANQYSGGEYDLVNFCFRVAISRHLLDTVGHHQTCIVLDEMFGSQDMDRRVALREHIRNLAQLEAGGLFQQIILISHIPDVLEDCDQLITLEEDAADGVSQVTSVTRGSATAMAMT